jgi:hypothetical protein
MTTNSLLILQPENRSYLDKSTLSIMTRDGSPRAGFWIAWILEHQRYSQSGEQFRDDIARHVRQAKIAPAEAVG